MPARLVKCTRYCLTQWSFEIYWVRQYLVFVVNELTYCGPALNPAEASVVKLTKISNIFSAVNHLKKYHCFIWGFSLRDPHEWNYCYCWPGHFRVLAGCTKVIKLTNQQSILGYSQVSWEYWESAGKHPRNQYVMCRSHFMPEVSRYKIGAGATI